MSIPVVIDRIVKNDLCIGCGMCVYACPSNVLKMDWNNYGFLVPVLDGNCDSKGECIAVCPFNPFPDDKVKSEDELGEFFLKDTEYYNSKIGKYVGIYAGYSKKFRLSSSSGGMATYLFSELLESKRIDHIFSITESLNTDVHYAYSVISSKDELLNGSKTKYFPVTLSTVMDQINSLEGKIAVVGVACFIKAIRLAQINNPCLQEKVTFLIGIICGGVKSRFFTEYLAGKAGIDKQNIYRPVFRLKDLKSTAGDYSFGCIDKSNKQSSKVKMRTVGDMWGTGLFKANACDFCDDVATELADISLGDAWLKPYLEDGAGTNIIVTRTKFANDLILSGIKKKDLVVDELPVAKFIFSQKGSYNHRHSGLRYRILNSKRDNKLVPPKRFTKETISFSFTLVQWLRMLIRRKSLIIWSRDSNVSVFDKKMRKFLILLKYVTKVYHYKGLNRKDK